MKNKKNIYLKFALLLGFIISFTASCERENSDEVELATFPINPEVFIDGFSSGLEYLPFNGSKLDAFTVDQETKYEGSASMRFDIPNVGDPEGAYAGAIFPDNTGRDLSGFNALTFWAKATQAGSINEIGFGNDFGENKYVVTVQNLQLSTNWKKYIIPIPDPSKLTQEKGLFWYAEGPEDDKGYSFWIDELQYENLGTIAHPEPAILNGSDDTQTTFKGTNINLSGLTQTFNLASGGNVTVNVSPSYFEFSSSNSDVATVNELGEVSIVGTGSAAITASIAGVAAIGSLTLESLGDFTSAPEPTKDPNDVISIFSDTYTNVPVDFYNGFYAPFQTTTSNDFEVNGDAILNYENYNFVGIEFNQNVPTINGSEMTNMHVDFFIPSAFDPESTIKIALVDFGADGAFGGGDDSEVTTVISSASTPALVSGEWISVDFDISGLANRSNLGQIVFSADGDNSPRPSNIYVDNIYLNKDGSGSATEPTSAAPAPMQAEADVISLFSDTYTDVAVDTWRTDWSAATLEDVLVEGNAIKKYSALNFVGIETTSNTVDATEMTHLRMDVWSADFTSLAVKLVDFGADGAFDGGDDAEHELTIDMPAQGEWVSLDIPLSDFTGLTTTGHIAQYILVGQPSEATTVYIDNFYFYKTGGSSATEPTSAAPTPPARDAADVVSLLSDAYTNVTVGEWSTGWDDADIEDFIVQGDNIKKVAFGDNGGFLGVDFSANSFDATAFTHFHMDYWVADAITAGQVLNPKWSNHAGGAEVNAFEYTNPVSQSGLWVSVDIPVSDFGGDTTRDNLAQFILATANTLDEVYIDNIYFYKTGGGSATEPTSGAPTPTQAEVDVISIYSDAYTAVSGTDFNPGWGQATVYTEESIAGNNTMLYTGLDYQGIALGSAQDVSGMEFLHIDYWSASSTALNTFLISSGPVETAKALTVPTGGGWTSVDIPLGDFSPVDLADVIQMKFDGDGDIYLDNIYFYKEPTAVAEPSLPLGFENGETLLPFDNGATAANIDNPDTNGNSSAKVLEFNKVVGSAWYSGVVFDETLRTMPLIDLANGTVFTIKIWSPNAGIPVRFQLEGGAAPAYEVFQTVNTANEWVTLTFDFTSQVNATDTYPKFSVFPDFDASNQVPVATEAIYYIDDITQQ